jgi:protein SCO1/2
VKSLSNHAGRWRSRVVETAAACALVAGIASVAGGQVILKSLPQQENVGIVEHRGDMIPLGLEFTNSRGKKVTLAEYFDGKRPVILVMAYYTCPLLCTKTLNEVQSTLNQLKWTAGDEYRVLTVSFDHRNTVAQAREKQAAYLAGYAKEVPESAWEFVVGDVDNIKALAKAVGFHYKFLPEQSEFSHPAALIFISPTGKISNYLERLDYPAGEVRLALSEAADNKIGTVFDRVVSFCFMYNPNTGKYTMVAQRVMMIGGLASMAGVGTLITCFAVARSRRMRALGVTSRVRNDSSLTVCPDSVFPDSAGAAAR